MESALILVALVGFAVIFYRNNRKKFLFHNGPMKEEWKAFMKEKVNFYNRLSDEDKVKFEIRVIDFLNKTRVIGFGDFKITAEDKILVGVSAIIPIFRFPNWEYQFINEVIIYPKAIPMGDSGKFANGFVGSGPMEGRMVLAKTALYHGYSNNTDRKNVGIHEFLHIIDKQDGEIDGVPEILLDAGNIGPWLEIIRSKSEEIANKKAKIRNYALANRAEFFSVVSEYFFEHPEMMEKKHPELFGILDEMFSHQPESE